MHQGFGTTGRCGNTVESSGKVVVQKSTTTKQEIGRPQRTLAISTDPLNAADSMGQKANFVHSGTNIPGSGSQAASADQQVVSILHS